MNAYSYRTLRFLNTIKTVTSKHIFRVLILVRFETKNIIPAFEIFLQLLSVEHHSALADLAIQLRAYALI